MSKTLYTFTVQCSFELQFTFPESDVAQDPDGDEGDLEPTERAIHALEAELYETLHQNYAVDEVQAFADSSCLLGTMPGSDDE
jgi:hypothetical protein